MKRRLTIIALTILAVVALISVGLTSNAPAQADGAKQIRGTGEFAEAGDCNDSEGNGADFALKFEGDLDGYSSRLPNARRAGPIVKQGGISSSVIM